jgi:hypothetical protein
MVPDTATPAAAVLVLLHVSGHSPQPPAAAIGMKQIATTKMATPIRVFGAESMQTSKQSSCPSLQRQTAAIEHPAAPTLTSGETKE